MSVHDDELTKSSKSSRCGRSSTLQQSTTRSNGGVGGLDVDEDDEERTRVVGVEEGESTDLSVELLEDFALSEPNR